MKKLLVFVFLVVLAVLLAGAYGIVHNQISHTVSPEYFTKFKFRQFGLLGLRLPDRVRASIVGFLASWWMGIPIGILVGAAGFMHRGHRRMLQVSLWSFLVVVAFTLCVGLLVLAYGYLQTASIDLVEYRSWYIPPNVENLRRFLCAGYMHNSSYLGGVLAIFAAWIFHVVVRVRTSSNPRLQRPAAGGALTDTAQTVLVSDAAAAEPPTRWADRVHG